MSWKKGLSFLGVEVTEDGASDAQAKSEAMSVPQAPQSFVPRTATFVQPAGPMMPNYVPPGGPLGTVDEEIRKGLKEAVTIKSDAYDQFLAFLAAMKAVPGGPAVHYPAALAAGAVNGLTMQAIADALKLRRQKLAAKREQFNQASMVKRQQLVDVKQTDIQGIDQRIAAAQEQIAQLQQQIGGLMNDKGRINGEITENTRKVEQAAANFEATIGTVSQELEGEVGLVGQYLGIQVS